MKTPSLKLPHINVNKKLVLITAGLLIVLALFSFAVVAEVKNERAQAEADRVTHIQAVQANKEQKQLIANQKAELAAQTTKTAQICQWVKGVQAQRKQAVPPLCL